MLWVLEHDGCPGGAWGQSERRNTVGMVTRETEIHLFQDAPEPHVILRTSAKFLYAFIFLSLLIRAFFVWLVCCVDQNNLQFSITLVKLFQSKQLQEPQTTATNYKHLKSKASISSWRKQVIPKRFPMTLKSQSTSFFHQKIIFFLFISLTAEHGKWYRDYSAHQAITICGETCTSTSSWGSKELVKPFDLLSLAEAPDFFLF